MDNIDQYMIDGRLLYWEELYRDTPSNKLPWYTTKLDDDFRKALNDLPIRPTKILDVGAGPGSQSFALANEGFSVTATDISQTAIDIARKVASEKLLDIRFVLDDITNSNLLGKFDLIIDRGCFHVLPIDMRLGYINATHNLLNNGGRLFIKSRSHEEKMVQGPYGFDINELHSLFSPPFSVHDIRKTTFNSCMYSELKSIYGEFIRK
jgi:2-polyprenyl-3-methyl-5-hydroxy-6-metoxy-1,4-benzoquinol methylase